MQSKTPLLMVTALVCGLGAAFGTWKLVSGQKENVAEDQKVMVLVPVTDVPAYYLFQDKARFTMTEWPKSRLREDEKETITDFDQIKGKTSRHYKLRPNEPIYKNDICDSVQNDVQDRLQNGEVAHAIPADANRSGGGFVKVGDRVNISATIPAGQGETAPRTQYLLEDIEILAVDNQGVRDQTNIAAPPTRFLLRLTGPQALALKYYQDSAKLDVDIRKPGDKTRLGDTAIYTANKKTSAIQHYNEDIPDPTSTVTLDAQKLTDPDENVPAPTKPTVAKTPAESDEMLMQQRSKLNNHEVNINDSGMNRKVLTNEKFSTTELVPVKKDKNEGKKDEKKEDPK